MPDLKLTFDGKTVILNADLVKGPKKGKKGKEEAKEEKAYVIRDDHETKKLYKLTGDYRPFVAGYFAKWFPDSVSAQNELDCIKDARSGPYFHYFPWVFPKLLEANPGSVLIQEYLQPYSITKHFKQVVTGNLDFRLIVLQFSQAFRQVLDAVNSLHNLKPAVYHGDVKPENILFLNNLLKIIDFDNATKGIQRIPAGDIRYMPNYALDAREKNRSLSCLNVLDLHLVVISFLETFIKCFFEDGPRSSEVKSLWQAIASKDTVAGDDQKKIDVYKTANKKINEIVSGWQRTNGKNPFVRSLSALLIDPNNQDKAYGACWAILNTSIEELCEGVHDCSAEVKPQKSAFFLSASTKPKEFAENMEYLLSNVTSNIFTSYYPLIYVDYAKTYGSYDGPAERSAEVTKELLRGIPKKGKCLDVGCAFGTSAYRAAKQGFRNIYCLDNSPVWCEVFQILWSKSTRKFWEYALNRLLSPEFLDIASIYLGTSHEAARKHFENLMEDRHGQFSEVASRLAGFQLADYWTLNKKADRFEYIVCNNFLHWPVIDYVRLQDRFPKTNTGFRSLMNIHLQSHHLSSLLFPLTKILASPGVLVLVEPSLFIRRSDDPKSQEEHEHFHSQRFSQDKDYKEITTLVRTDLLDDCFGFKRLPRPDPYFELADLYTAAKNLGCKVSRVEPIPYSTPEGWRKLILGEFAMTTRDFTPKQIQQMTQEHGKLKEFYKKFGELVDSRISTKEPNIKFCQYLIFVTKGF